MTYSYINTKDQDPKFHWLNAHNYLLSVSMSKMDIGEDSFETTIGNSRSSTWWESSSIP